MHPLEPRDARCVAGDWGLGAGDWTETGDRDSRLPRWPACCSHSRVMSCGRIRLMSTVAWCWPLMLAVVLTAQESTPPSRELPAPATAQLAKSLAASKSHAKHVW